MRVRGGKGAEEGEGGKTVSFREEESFSDDKP